MILSIRLLSANVADGLASKPLLQRIEAGRSAALAALVAAAYQQFAVQYRRDRQGGGDLGKGGGNVVA